MIMPYKDYIHVIRMSSSCNVLLYKYCTLIWCDNLTAIFISIGEWLKCNISMQTLGPPPIYEGEKYVNFSNFKRQNIFCSKKVSTCSHLLSSTKNTWLLTGKMGKIIKNHFSHSLIDFLRLHTFSPYCMIANSLVHNI